MHDLEVWNEARVERCKTGESVSLHKLENIQDAQNVFTATWVITEQ